MTGVTRPVVERLWQLYRHDLSEYRGSLPDVAGLFHTRPLDPFLEGDPDRAAHLFLQYGPVGFALYPGAWEIPFQEENAAAARFWRRVAAEAAADGVREERRPVPGKAHIPPDVWLTLTVG